MEMMLNLKEYNLLLRFMDISFNGLLLERQKVGKSSHMESTWITLGIQTHYGFKIEPHVALGLVSRATLPYPL